MNEDVSSAVQFFRGSWVNTSIKEVTTGHIHQSFLVSNSDNLDICIFLQRFNSQVFPNYSAVFSNVEIVCEELAKNQYSLQIPIPLRSDSSNEKFYTDSSGYIWRAFLAIPEVYSIDVADSDQRVYSAAKAFAEFQHALKNLNSTNIQDPILGFMNNPDRFDKLQSAVRSDSYNRLSTCKAELEFIINNKSSFEFIASSRRTVGNHPRATHGDMKLNNVLFCSKTHQPKSIIDLDTCMIGDYLYDYGDFMRIACANSVEDEPNLDLVFINNSFVTAATNGFRDGYPDAISGSLWNNLKKAAAEVTLTIATRFLTDYLEGDKYFRVKAPNHNLTRTRCQLRLFSCWRL